MGIESSPLDGGQRKAGAAGHLEGVVETSILLPGVGNLVKDRDGGVTTVAVHLSSNTCFESMAAGRGTKRKEEREQ